MEIISTFRELDGGKLHFLSSGKGENTVLFLHGISFNARVWEDTRILSEIGKAGYHALAVDLPGYGESSPLEMPDADLLLPVVTAMGIRDAVIIAPSFSGRFALPFILDHPSRVNGFVSVASRAIDTHQDRLREINCPVLAVWGEKDDVIPLELADTLVGSVPSGRKVLIPDGTHAPYLSDPERFTREVLTFLDTCRKKPEIA